MKSMTAIAAVIGIAFAAASSSSALANSAPGSTPSKPNKVATPPPPPPPGGPDKLTTRPQPPVPGNGPSSVPWLNYWPSPGPKLVDDLAGPRQPPRPPRPGVGNVTSVPKAKKGELFGPCNNSDCNETHYTTDCKVASGGMSSEPGGAISCNTGPQHDPK